MDTKWIGADARARIRQMTRGTRDEVSGLRYQRSSLWIGSPHLVPGSAHTTARLRSLWLELRDDVDWINRESCQIRLGAKTVELRMAFEALADLCMHLPTGISSIAHAEENRNFLADCVWRASPVVAWGIDRKARPAIRGIGTLAEKTANMFNTWEGFVGYRPWTRGEVPLTGDWIGGPPFKYCRKAYPIVAAGLSAEWNNRCYRLTYEAREGRTYRSRIVHEAALCLSGQIGLTAAMYDQQCLRFPGTALAMSAAANLELSRAVTAELGPWAAGQILAGCEHTAGVFLDHVADRGLYEEAAIIRNVWARDHELMPIQLEQFRQAWAAAFPDLCPKPRVKREKPAVPAADSPYVPSETYLDYPNEEGRHAVAEADSR